MGCAKPSKFSAETDTAAETPARQETPPFQAVDAGAEAGSIPDDNLSPEAESLEQRNNPDLQHLKNPIIEGILTIQREKEIPEENVPAFTAALVTLEEAFNKESTNYAASGVVTAIAERMAAEFRNYQAVSQERSFMQKTTPIFNTANTYLETARPYIGNRNILASIRDTTGALLIQR